MTYPFRMYGRIVQLYRYQAVYMEWLPNEAGEFVDREVTGYFINEAEAQRTGGVVRALDVSAYEWLDGIEIAADVPDAYAEAVRTCEMGEEAYREVLSQPTQDERIAQLEAENAALSEQLTNTQLALCDVYEAMTAMEGGVS